MKIEFNSDDKLPLNNTIEISATTKIFRAVFHANNKSYSQDVLDEFLYKI